MKQETLEEAFSQYVNEKYHSPTQGSIPDLESARFGAKWQQEQDKKMYSELSLFLEKEADKDRLKSLTSNQIRTLIEQFKNK
jgi:hypothetical protein